MSMFGGRLPLGTTALAIPLFARGRAGRWPLRHLAKPGRSGAWTAWPTGDRSRLGSLYEGFLSW